MSQARPTGINLSEATAVLVQFHFNNPRVIPQGLRSIERRSEQELIEKRKQEMGRTNAVETRGHQVIKDLQRVQVALLRLGLANNGLRLVDAHTSQKPRADGSMRHITTLSFRRLDATETPSEIPAEAMTGLRSLAIDAVWTAHVWWNPNGVMVIDLVQRQPQVVPLHSIVVRNGWVVAVKVVRLLGEDDEDVRIADELLDELKGLRVA